MKILLSYSKTHFDPELPQSKHKYWGSSANILARALYAELGTLGDVTYIDAYSQSTDEIADQFDVFVGISTRFAELADASGASKKLLFAVNMHPKSRNEILQNFVEKNHLQADALRDWDIVDVKELSSSIQTANGIICVGNVAVYNSYIQQGVPKNKIKMINYGVGKPSSPKKKKNEKVSFVYVASDIGLRKGVHILNEVFESLSQSDQEYSLDIIGKVADSHTEKILKNMKVTAHGKIKIHGWIDAASSEYSKVLGKADFVVGPSLEEGQAGAILDAMRHGVIPIITANTGIDYSPLGYLEMRLESPQNAKLLREAVSLNRDKIDSLKQSTIEYYSELHYGFEAVLRTTIQDYLDGSLYPRVSVVLPIFNKASTIVPLLTLLDEALTAYQNVELHVIFDGCKDATEEVVRAHYDKKPAFEVTYEVTPNIFEVKSNNLGLRKSKGKYSIIIQDDNFIYDRNFIFEAVTFLDKNPSAAILGCLAGVNYYPRGTVLVGKGQISLTPNETYWRQDEQTDAAYADQIFQVDACMRGPLILRKQFLEDYGYLDEIYVPFYMDDMDIAFRAGSVGKKVYCMLSDVDNLSFTIAKYDKKRNEFWERTMKKNAQTFYDRWKPSIEKKHLRLQRTKISDPSYQPRKYSADSSLSKKLKRRIRRAARIRYIFNDEYCRSISDSRWKARMAWVEQQAALVPKNAKVLDIGAGQTPYRQAFAHTQYVTQDLAQTPDFEYGKIDIISDIANIPLPDASQDYILCTEVFEHIPEPIKALKEISRLLKPGGRLIFSAPLASGQHQAPYHFYGGYTRYWYQKFFTESDLALLSLVPNGGLNAHTIEMLWRSQPQIVGSLMSGNLVSRFRRKLVQIAMYNYPTIKLDIAESEKVDEDFTACFFCIAEKR